MSNKIASPGEELKPFVETVAVKPNLSIEDDVEKYIRAEVFQNQIRIKDFFEDFDKLRKGWVTEDKFRSALSRLKIHLTEKMIQSLINRYKGEDGLMQYQIFCNNVEQQFYDQENAKKNLLVVKSHSNYTGEEKVL